MTMKKLIIRNGRWMVDGFQMNRNRLFISFVNIMLRIEFVFWIWIFLILFLLLVFKEYFYLFVRFYLNVIFTCKYDMYILYTHIWFLRVFCTTTGQPLYDVFFRSGMKSSFRSSYSLSDDIKLVLGDLIPVERLVQTRFNRSEPNAHVHKTETHVLFI